MTQSNTNAVDGKENSFHSKRKGVEEQVPLTLFEKGTPPQWRGFSFQAGLNSEQDRLELHTMLWCVTIVDLRQ